MSGEGDAIIVLPLMVVSREPVRQHDFGGFLFLPYSLIQALAHPKSLEVPCADKVFFSTLVFSAHRDERYPFSSCLTLLADTIFLLLVSKATFIVYK